MRYGSISLGYSTAHSFKVDIPAAAYQLSFENNPGWSQYYAPGGEILDYWKRVSEKYAVYRYMTFNAQVIEAKWNEDEGLWVLQIKDTKSGRVNNPLPFLL